MVAIAHTGTQATQCRGGVDLPVWSNVKRREQHGDGHDAHTAAACPDYRPRPGRSSGQRVGAARMRGGLARAPGREAMASWKQSSATCRRPCDTPSIETLSARGGLLLPIDIATAISGRFRDDSCAHPRGLVGRISQSGDASSAIRAGGGPSPALPDCLGRVRNAYESREALLGTVKNGRDLRTPIEFVRIGFCRLSAAPHRSPRRRRAPLAAAKSHCR